MTIICQAILSIAYAQQPRTSVVDDYLDRTGTPQESSAVATVKHLPMLAEYYESAFPLLLDMPEVGDRGFRELMPFGFCLSSGSEVPMADSGTGFPLPSANLAVSRPMKLYNRSLADSVQYLFCDSMVYGVRLFSGAEKEEVRRLLQPYFGQPDYENHAGLLYSDDDYAVRFHEHVGLEVYSLYHYPAEETRFPGVVQRLWRPPFFHVAISDAGLDVPIDLAFFNQTTKENNVQSAFRLATDDIGLRQITFLTPDTVFVYALYPDEPQLQKASRRPMQTCMRTFVSPDVMRLLARASRVEVVVEGSKGRVSYAMPMSQRMSQRMVYEQFRRISTNFHVKYPHW